MIEDGIKRLGNSLDSSGRTCRLRELRVGRHFVRWNESVVFGWCICAFRRCVRRGAVTLDVVGYESFWRCCSLLYRDEFAHYSGIPALRSLQVDVSRYLNYGIRWSQR
jgi:hypothetical protein